MDDVIFFSTFREEQERVSAERRLSSETMRKYTLEKFRNKATGLKKLNFFTGLKSKAAAAAAAGSSIASSSNLASKSKQETTSGYSCIKFH